MDKLIDLNGLSTAINKLKTWTNDTINKILPYFKGSRLKLTVNENDVSTAIITNLNSRISFKYDTNFEKQECARVKDVIGKSYGTKGTPFYIEFGSNRNTNTLYVLTSNGYTTEVAELFDIQIDVDNQNSKLINGVFITDEVARISDVKYNVYKELAEDVGKSGLNEEQYKKAQVFLYEPFMISSIGETSIPDEFLNSSKNNFFVDYYWKYAFLTGGVPIKTITWDSSNRPSILCPIYDNSQTYKIDFANKKIIKQ